MVTKAQYKQAYRLERIRHRIANDKAIPAVERYNHLHPLDEAIDALPRQLFNVVWHNWYDAKHVDFHGWVNRRQRLIWHSEKVNKQLGLPSVWNIIKKRHGMGVGS